MKSKIITAIIKKDATMAIRNNLILIAIIGGILFSLIYYALPSEVDDTYEMAIYDDGSSKLMSILGMSGGLELRPFDSLEGMMESVEGGDYLIGIHVPKDFDLNISEGIRPALVLYFNNGIPESSRSTFEFIIGTALETLTSGEVPDVLEYEVLGVDTSGQEVPLRDRSLPLYIIFALMMEMWTISTLIVEENALGTLRAVLVTPATSSDVISAKSLVGFAYTLVVVSVILLLTQSLRGDALALLASIFVSALFAVSLGLFLGSLTDDITGSYIYVAVPLLILIIPAILIFIPDASISIVKAIPTYYMVNAFDSILNFGANMGGVLRDVGLILALDVVLFFMGVFSLRRRYS